MWYWQGEEGVYHDLGCNSHALIATTAFQRIFTF